MQKGFQFSGEFSDDHKDVVFTRPEVAKEMVSHFPLSGRVLDPCRGDGAFWNLIDGADYCEIQEGKDFFEYEAQVDWIIGNPPYSVYSAWLTHSMKVADNIVYFIPLAKVFSSATMLDRVYNYGGIAEIVHLGAGRSVGVPVGYPVGAVHYKRDYAGGIIFRTRPATKEK